MPAPGCSSWSRCESSANRPKARAGSAPNGATAISPAGVNPSSLLQGVGQRPDLAGAGTAAGRRSGRLRQVRLVKVHLDQAARSARGSSPAACRRSCSAAMALRSAWISCGRSTECSRSAYWTTDLALFVCSCPMKCQRRPAAGQFRGLCRGFLVPVLPDVGHAQLMQQRHVGGREELRHHYQLRLRRAPGGGPGDPLPDAFQVR